MRQRAVWMGWRIQVAAEMAEKALTWRVGIRQRAVWMGWRIQVTVRMAEEALTWRAGEQESQEKGW